MRKWGEGAGRAGAEAVIGRSERMVRMLWVGGSFGRGYLRRGSTRCWKRWKQVCVCVWSVRVGEEGEEKEWGGRRGPEGMCSRLELWIARGQEVLEGGRGCPEEGSSEMVG